MQLHVLTPSFHCQVLLPSLQLTMVVSGSHTPLKILFFPFMAQGHMLPMADMASLFAARGVAATIFTTPANAHQIQSSVDTADNNNNPVRLHVVPFPPCPGLPAGCENISSIPSPELVFSFFGALSMLRDDFDRAMAELAPDAVVTDMFLTWTADVAAEHGVPRLVFHGTNFFARCGFDSLEKNMPEGDDEDETFVVPGLPHEIRLLISQIDRTRNNDPVRAKLFSDMRESDYKSYGVVVNSFYELEPDYVKHYRDVLGRKAWHIGPVSLCNNRSTDSESCVNWLESKTPRSVVYVCFGSMADFSAAQVGELAAGLEATNRPFIWVLRKGNGEALPEGFEERTKGRGLIVRGWAPQILILEHESVGCFVTHCGWNSSLEAISVGLPLVTWPLFADQFFNERLIVDVLKIGVAVGVKKYARGPEEREVVGAAAIRDCVERVMGGGEEAEERRRRAEELGMAARTAVEEGGSSYIDMSNLIQELTERRKN